MQNKENDSLKFATHKITKEKQMKMQKKKVKRNAFYTMILMLLFFLIVIFNTTKLEILHVSHGRNLDNIANMLYTEKIENSSQRGDIYSSDGEALAINVPTYDMYAIVDKDYKDLLGKPDYVMDPDKTEKDLLGVLNLTNDENAKKIFHEQLNKTDVKQVEFSTYGKSLSVDQKNAIDKKNLPGIKFNSHVERRYPFNDFASYILGYSVLDDENKNVVGKMGVEKMMDGFLKGQDFSSSLKVDHNKIPLKQQQSTLIKTEGSNVTLTIDSQIQMFIENAMDKYYKGKKFQNAFTIVMDAKNGRILGANAIPSFDPNKRDVKLWTNPFTDFFFEPGSTMKTFLVAAAMEEGKWNPSKVYKSGTVTKPDWGLDANKKPIHISDSIYNEYGLDWGNITWEKAFYYSSNVGMVDILETVTNKVWEHYMTDIFKFGTPVSSENMKNESGGDWTPEYPIEYANSTFGQGVTVNALQMLRGYSAFTNKGKMVNPHIIQSMQDPTSGEIFYNDETDKTLKPVKVVSPETATKILKLLKGVVYYVDPDNKWNLGTASAYKNGKVKIGAKTGTSEISKKDGYEALNKASYISSVMAVAPIDDPQIILYSVVVAPKVDSALSYDPQSVNSIIDNTIEYLNNDSTIIDQKKIDKNQYQIEDYRGQDIKTIDAKLKKAGVNTIKIGNGKIVDQYPSNKQVISKNQVVILRAKGTFDYHKLNKMPYNEALGICYAQDWDCQFNGLGNVYKIEKINETTYKIDLEVPKDLKNDIKNKK